MVVKLLFVLKEKYNYSVIKNRHILTLILYNISKIMVDIVYI